MKKQPMTDRERFLAVATGQTPDYVPIFGFPGAPGMSHGCLRPTHERLVAGGMPAHVGGCVTNWQNRDVESWFRYWGTTGPVYPDFGLAWGAEGIKSTSREEDGFMIVEGEDGSVTREVLDNADTYSMPEYRVYPVRDRAGWEFHKTRTKPRQFMSRADMEANCKRFDKRNRPLVIGAGGTYGSIRSMMGVEAASMALYDDPELIHDIIDTWRENNNEGQGRRIEHEIRCKVPPLLAKGRYFPNGDHGIQPPVTFPNLCKFMTILHEVCNNPEGEFPRG